MNLQKERSKEPLPAALLKFSGRTLLEGLFRDLQGREYLYYKLTGKQALTPVALLVSKEKNNEQHIRAIIEEHSWFYRPKSRFFFLNQPLAPVITKEGDWALSQPLPNRVSKTRWTWRMWKVAFDSGIIDKLMQLKREKALVRQINNPIAGTDLGLLALSGIGCHQQKSFGFASCFRRLGASEGMDVLLEKKTAQGFEYCLTNIEYTEFKRLGIKDIPESPGSSYSQFPANTNILFVECGHCP